MTKDEVPENRNRLGWAAVSFVLVAMLFIACTAAPTPTKTPPEPTATLSPAPIAPIEGSDAAPPAAVQDHPGGASGFSRFVFEQVRRPVIASLRTWRSRLRRLEAIATREVVQELQVLALGHWLPRQEEALEPRLRPRRRRDRVRIASEHERSGRHVHEVIAHLLVCVELHLAGPILVA